VGKLRVGVIGVGGIATSAHIPGYKRLGGEVELAAVADVNLERARQVAAEHGISGVYHDYRAMLAAERLDAVSVCTPNALHAPASLAALEAGCHVLCEKPPAMSPEEVSAVAETARRTGRIYTVALNFRFDPEVVLAKRFIDGGGLGEIYAARVRVRRRRGVPSWGGFTNKRLQGGGPMIDMGVHFLDVALYLMGYAAPRQILGTTYTKVANRTEVMAWGAYDRDGYEVEDLAFGMITLDSGATVLIEASFADNCPKEENYVLLSGTKAGLELPPLRIFREECGALTDTTIHWLPRQDMYAEEVRHFVACCRGDERPVVTPDQAVILQQMVSGIYQSAAAGKAISL
jgi:predicted dehydrogenase